MGSRLHRLRVRISANARTGGSGRVRVRLSSDVGAWPTLKTRILEDERDLRVKRPSRGGDNDSDAEARLPIGKNLRPYMHRRLEPMDASYEEMFYMMGSNKEDK